MKIVTDANIYLAVILNEPENIVLLILQKALS